MCHNFITDRLWRWLMRCSVPTILERNWQMLSVN
ncbi:unnamed protein product [Brassica oleracea var. botrytis]|uniref:Uncharacterized protein n=1 Tax=Brassica oleracea TaxID=3712 RepID=A0A3P6DUH6_BRAOL|nr:unnamed protein product [Brassica oleracea]